LEAIGLAIITMRRATGGSSDFRFTEMQAHRAVKYRHRLKIEVGRSQLE
jgi:hypothetical protein